mgnify:CR=1 FL=1
MDPRVLIAQARAAGRASLDDILTPPLLDHLEREHDAWVGSYR